MMTDELYDESGFFFRQRKGKLNLRKLEAIDLEKVIREVDVDLLQQCIENITFSEFQDYDIHYLTDKQIVKLFKLSQLTIEYLLFTQRKLVTNLTDLAKKYSLKKKSLYRKRKELAYLKEETTRLQIQLKTKRRNLQTLEKLIESANQDHDWFLQQQQKQLADKLGQKVPENRGLIKFFVGFPDGMFIELEESSEITIKYLISVINNLLFYERSAVGNNKNATVPGGVRKISSAEMDHPSLYDNNSQNIKLFLRGKLLMVNATLSQAGVITGDTLLATFAFPPTESKEPEIKQETKVDDQSAVTKSLVEALASQTNCIQRLAEEINGWKKVVSDTPKEVVAKDDGRLADHLDHRLKLMELEIRESLKALPRPEDLKPRLVFGELENDDEARFNPKFDALSSQMEQIGTAVRSMKSILEDQQVQVNELRRSLSERVAPVVPNIVIQNPLQPVINQQAPQPAPQPIIIEKEVHIAAAKPAAMKTVEKSIVRASSNRWNMLPYQTNEEVRAEPTTPAVVEVQKVEEIVFNPKKEPERKKPEVREEPKPVKKEVIETPKPVIKKADPATVLIVFPYQHNPLLKAAMMSATGAASGSFGPTDGVAIEMKSSLSDKDEIIAFIRTMIAMQVNTKMQNVYLTMENRTIKLAFDLPPSATFSPQEVVEYAGSGKLQVGIHGLRTVSNVQIDLLFPAFEKENPAPKSNDKNKSKNMAKVPLSAAGQALTKQKSNRVNTDNKNEDVPELKAISQIRGSLQNLLEELDNVQSLSDVDLAKKRADLEAYSSTSEIEGLKDTRTSVIKSLGSMTLLGDDFPTEDYIEHKQRSLAMSKSGDVLTTKASAKDVGRDSLDEKENRRRKNPRESKSLRLSEKSYEEDYKRMMESVESLPLTDSRMSADYQNAMRKSVQRRSYYEDDEFEGEDRSRASYGQPIMRGQRGGGGGGYYDEKSAASSRFDISSPMDYSNSFQHPRSLPVSSNRSNLMKPDFTTTLNSTNGDDTLVFSSEGNDTPFNMTNNSSLVSSMRPQEKFLNTQEIQRRADHFERQAERDLYGGEDDEDERGLQDDEDTLNMTNNTSNNSQNTRHNTTTDSPFKEFRRFNATGNTAGTTLTNNTFSTTGSSGRSRGRYRDEDEAGDMEEDDMEEKRREPFTPSALNEGIGRRAEGGRRRNPLDESLDEENDRYAAHNNNDTASVHSLALSDT